MSELTKEHFDQVVKTLATKQDVRDGVEELARMVNAGFEDVHDRLDVVGRVQKLEADMHQIKHALNITA